MDFSQIYNTVFPALALFFQSVGELASSSTGDLLKFLFIPKSPITISFVQWFTGNQISYDLKNIVFEISDTLFGWLNIDVFSDILNTGFETVFKGIYGFLYNLFPFYFNLPVWIGFPLIILLGMLSLAVVRFIFSVIKG